MESELDSKLGLIFDRPPDGCSVALYWMVDKPWEFKSGLNKEWAIKPHKDNEHDMDPSFPFVVSVSSGAVGPFYINSRAWDSVHSLPLDGGDIVVFNRFESHGVGQHVGPRVNFTFRWWKRH